MSQDISSRVAVRAKAPGKINLALTVGPRKADGYHDLVTCFQAVDLWETVTVSPADSYSVTIEGDVNLGEVPLNKDNLVIKAAELVADVLGVTRAVSVHIDKRVPVGGGMGGGSADAAATLVAVNQLWQAGLTDQELEHLGATLGADVPFALRGFTQRGLGNGSHLDHVDSLGFSWVIIPSLEHLSTPLVYGRLDELRGDQVPELPEDLSQGLRSALFSGDARALAGYLDNDMQVAAFSLLPELEQILDQARSMGALQALVSGSGPTCVALAENEQHASQMVDALNQAGRYAFSAQSPVRGAHLVPIP